MAARSPRRPRALIRRPPVHTAHLPPAAIRKRPRRIRPRAAPLIHLLRQPRIGLRRPLHRPANRIVPAPRSPRPPIAATRDMTAHRLVQPAVGIQAPPPAVPIRTHKLHRPQPPRRTKARPIRLRRRRAPLLLPATLPIDPAALRIMCPRLLAVRCPAATAPRLPVSDRPATTARRRGRRCPPRAAAA